MTNYNVASLLTDSARKWPDRLAVIAPHRPDVLGRGRVTYRELDESSSKLAAHLLRKAAPGSRVIVLVKPGLDFVAIIFGLFKAGLVPVMVDPGMGLARMLRCLGEGRPSGIIGLSIAHVLSLTAPGYFKSIKMRVTLGRRFGWGGPTLLEIMKASADAPELPVPAQADDLAAILFTSGSTGPPKGVIYTHAMFRAQVETIREGLDFREGGLDLATFPLFGLFAPVLGLTSVFPDINAAKPGRADPRSIIEPIIQHGVSSMFISPTLVGNVARYAHENNLSLPSLRRVIMAGAPASPRTVTAFTSLMSAEAGMQTPYGATEGMPLSTISGAEIIAETRLMTEQGLGMCVGRPLPGVDLKVIRILDKPIARLDDDLFLPVGEIGEIVARGPMVSPAYFERPRATAQAIIETKDGFWRRMGDVGWIDDRGRLWFCGRKAHRVITGQGTLFSIPCEAIFNNHPQVRRSALVGLGRPGYQRPVIIIEPQTALRGVKWNILLEELAALAKTNPRTLSINTFLKCRAFPVDVRHNAKINREKLAVWAAGKLKNA